MVASRLLADDALRSRRHQPLARLPVQDFLVQGGLNILSTNRKTWDTLPIPLSRIDRMFRSLNEFDLRTTALDLVGVRPL